MPDALPLNNVERFSLLCVLYCDTLSVASPGVRHSPAYVRVLPKSVFRRRISPVALYGKKPRSCDLGFSYSSGSEAAGPTSPGNPVRLTQQNLCHFVAFV